VGKKDYVHRKIFFFQAEDGIRDFHVTGVQTCALPISGGTSGAGRTDWAGGTSGTSGTISTGRTNWAGGASGASRTISTGRTNWAGRKSVVEGRRGEAGGRGAERDRGV